MADFCRVLRGEAAAVAGVGSLGDADRAMVIAVSVVGMMQVTVDEIIHVIAVRYGFVTAAFAMHVGCIVAATSVAAGASSRVCGVDGERMFVEVAVVGVVQMAVVDVVDVAVVQDGGMPAAGAVDMGMIVVDVVRHGAYFLPFVSELRGDTGLARGAGCSVECASALKIRPETCWSASE